MPVGLVGKKCGMTRIFTEKGEAIPVTVLHFSSNRIAQIKSLDIDGYNAVQIVSGSVRRLSHINKPMAGHFKKGNVKPGKSIHEFRLLNEELDKFKLGEELSVEIFKEGEKVDVRARSKGKGFAGTIKRHNFKGQDATHGNSLAHRAPGSIGQCQTPGRVLKGKKMAGQMGNVYCSVQNQEIVQVDPERNLLLVKGAVPGAPTGEVVVIRSVKSGE